MYSALDLFHTHVRHILSIMFALLTAVFAILGFTLQDVEGSEENLDSILKIGGAMVLILILPLGAVSILIIGRYYRLYVAALVYAANLHKAEGIDGHQWFREIERYRQRLGVGASDDDLIRRRTYGWPHSWILYSIVIITQALGSFAFGVVLLTAI